MTEASAADRDPRGREWWIAVSALTAVVLLRSAVFVIWPQPAGFDSDEAISGLMAKHLSELRAFPVFFYGNNYILGVEAWLAAPLFALAGPSVTALRLPLLAVNIAIALMLLGILVRETGLRPLLAAVPILFFALAPPGTTMEYLEANGGNVEPLAYVLLLWLTRRRPNWGGVIFAVGFLHREFTLYGLIALLAIEAARGTLFTRVGIRRRLAMLRTGAEVWLFVQWIKLYSSAAGPGTTMEHLYRSHDNLVELAGRMCFDLATLPFGAWRLITIHWPTLFGTAPRPLVEFSIDTKAWQGITGGSLLLGATIAVAATIVVRRLIVERRWRPEYDACAYLVLVALLSSGAFVVARCGEVGLMRYELLSILGAVGLGAWCLRASTGTWTRRVWVALALGVVLISAVAHARLLGEYVAHPPVAAKQMLARHLEARGVRYAYADYWLAYSLTFLRNEQTIVASEDFIRIPEYNRIVEAHRSEAIRISRGRACAGGQQVMPGIYFCPPD
ncbi:MAG: hypothetical protein A3H96_15220 [Acidobacteria bacterium RIFCSPLOWO2_02_FULL_67_36]|nr:MAG: hypothetical protein A3H96_15220 [Acidobacteria bacterium RIFCSPLOWO2_02_FULL_67_36]OFW19329.1 MAG: hypothetical protein A3G21_02425 [Acidobacteria bacterium RIFCSPLOWO2_12_FULL_66_21]